MSLTPASLHALIASTVSPRSVASGFSQKTCLPLAAAAARENRLLAQQLTPLAVALERTAEAARSAPSCAAVALSHGVRPPPPPAGKANL